MNDPKTIFEPIAGYLLDVVAKLRNKEFVPHSLTKLQNLYVCKKTTNARTIVEIGSYKGVTTKRLSRFFEKVISIEIDDELFKQAKTRCEARQNVKLIKGDGKEKLKEISPDVEKAVLFLDGHYSGEGTGIGSEPEPVLLELEVIKPFLNNYVAIVIDDFRLFGIEDGWPYKHEVLQYLEKNFLYPDWSISILNDQFIVKRR